MTRNQLANKINQLAQYSNWYEAQYKQYLEGTLSLSEFNKANSHYQYCLASWKALDKAMSRTRTPSPPAPQPSKGSKS